MTAGAVDQSRADLANAWFVSSFLSWSNTFGIFAYLLECNTELWVVKMHGLSPIFLFEVLFTYLLECNPEMWFVRKSNKTPPTRGCVQTLGLSLNFLFEVIL